MCTFIPNCVHDVGCFSSIVKIIWHACAVLLSAYSFSTLGIFVLPKSFMNNWVKHSPYGDALVFSLNLEVSSEQWKTLL